MRRKSANFNISEREWQNQVIQLAKLYKWKIHAERPARTKHGWKTPIQGDPGFPDLVLVKQFGDQAVLIIAELKTEKGKISPQQRKWSDLLYLVQGVTMAIWRPSDFDEVRGILK